jgi:uracil-DNA glycosylase
MSTVKDNIIDKLVTNNFITEDWGYFAKKAFRIFYKDIAPKLQASTVATFPENSTDIFKAFKLCPLDNLKVIIVGQDPYHDGSATGLAFDNIIPKKISGSLRNILQEIVTDIPEEANKARIRVGSHLAHLPPQGVLLVNAALTVELGSANSQYAMWQEFTKEMFTAINTKDDIVWVLWGNFAQRFEPLITNPTHEVIKGVHPSPLSANGKGEGSPKFFGSKPFSKVNEYLKKHGKKKIVW